MRNWAPRLSLRSIARDHGRLGAVEHVAELERAEQVLVEDAALVVDRDVLVLLLEPPDDLERGVQALLVAEHGARTCPSSSPSSALISDDAPAGAAIAPHELADPALLVGEQRLPTAG